MSKRATLEATIYSEALDRYVQTTVPVELARRPSGLRSFIVEGREVAVQLPRGAILISGGSSPTARLLRRAETVRMGNAK